MQQDEEPLDPQAERLAIRKRAMDMLARREHAPAALADKLAKRDHDREQISSVLDELIAKGCCRRPAMRMPWSRRARPAAWARCVFAPSWRPCKSTTPR
ncbi:hypothetical protein [Salinisphaera shabanensis]|uniref:hypothetical protein n=1 Tax=Salinisphaera shabanensis TaxID=180542 RepID=UPI003B849275